MPSYLVETYLARQNDKVRRFLAAAREGPREWYDASMIGEQSLMLTAGELTRALEQIDEILEPFKRRNRPDPPPAARPVAYQFRAVPIDDGKGAFDGA